MENQTLETVADITQNPEQRYRNFISDLRLNSVKLDTNINEWFEKRNKKELDACLLQLTTGIEGIVGLHPDITMDDVRNMQDEKRERNGGFDKMLVLAEDRDGREHPDLPKLIRDRVPEHMDLEKVQYKVRKATGREMPELLAKKLREELSELTRTTDDSKLEDELVDMLEVVDQMHREIELSPMGYGRGTGFRGLWRFLTYRQR
ncbi:hypothetical protein M1615_02385 [Patescibacteria group bacterium]|nr:hypothetical protein [Patescibacteria group bacterium]